MTIKDFSLLCGCNPQTLRYYDRIGLLRPASVDQWSGYRCYDEEQAADFVKIRNLQKADFTIEEIKRLLDGDDGAVYEAFGKKIAEAEKKLQEMKDIRMSYLTEMKDIRERIRQAEEDIVRLMRDYGAAEEFGISEQEHGEFVASVVDMFRHVEIPDAAGMAALPGSCDAAPEKDHDPRKDPDFRTVYEKHGWERVKDFLDEFSELEDGGYSVYVLLGREKAENASAFYCTMLKVLLDRNKGKRLHIGCNGAAATDGANHLWLLRHI